MSKTVAVYYALQSPWTYLGWRRFLDLAAGRTLDVIFRPINMAPVFAASGGLPLAQRPAQRQAYRMMELKRWRDVLGVSLNLTPKFFPTNENQAALMVLAHGRQGGDMGKLSFAMMRAVWAEDRDLSDPLTLKAIAAEEEIDGEALIAASKTEAVEAAYQVHTEAAIKAGVFGVPTFAVGDELFWGQDRLDLLARALA